MNKLRILLAEDHEIVRNGIKLLINEQDDMEVVGEADNGDAAVQLAGELVPDIVIMDISMPKTNGLKATRRLKRMLPAIKILTLTRHMNNGYVQQLIQAGVSGYVLKQSAPTELINAIRAVGDDNSFLDATVTQTVMNSLARHQGRLQNENKTDITEREEEVLRFTARGFSNKHIGEQLDISVKTVETHKSNAMRKLGISDRVDVVNYAILKGWMDEE